MKTVTDVFKELKAELEQAGVDTPVADARLLVQHALGLRHEDILMNPGMLVDDAKLISLKAAAERRKNREPVSRIVGNRAFWKYDFKVSRETLDPRPDSETIIEAALKLPRPQTVLDLGTGTGCLLLSLLGEWPEAKGTGVDISAGAIATAAENAANLGLSPRATFAVTDWEAFSPEAPFDMVVSNPPYIAEDEIPTLEPEVRQYDPMTALVGGRDGLAAYRVIVGRLGKWLKSGGWVLFEIGYRQAEDVKGLLANSGFDMIQVVQDLGGNDRVVLAKNP